MKIENTSNRELKIPPIETTASIGTDNEIGTSPEMTMLPQQRKEAGKQKLNFKDLFFEYESNLKALETEIDSLKSVVKGYEKGQTMPNVSRDILDLIKVPASQHRVELQNGTVVSGELLEESDSSLTLKTQIGTLVLKKEMVFFFVLMVVELLINGKGNFLKKATIMI